MESRIIKLKGLELENFKNVKYGKIDFKEDKTNGEISNILGIYGQNGSGKTSVINALYLLKMIILSLIFIMISFIVKDKKEYRT